MLRLVLYQLIKKERDQMMTSQESVFKVNIRSFKRLSQEFHVRMSVAKQYQMMMSSVARVKCLKTKVIFWYHTKGVPNHVSSYSDHEIKSYSCSNSSTKMGKNEKVGRNCLDYKAINKGLTNWGRF